MPKSLLPTLLLVLFTVSSLFLPWDAARAQTCQEIFKAADSIGTFKSTFRHQNKYSNELSEQSAIKNQCQLGTCHLHTWASSIEKSYLKRTGERIEVSMPYVTAVHWMDRAIQAASNKNPKLVKVQLGATIVDSRAVIRKFGVVPEGVWTPRLKFEVDPVASRLEEFVVNAVAKAKWELAREANEAKRQKIVERAEADLNRLFSSIAGDLPKSFSYEGKTYTPLEFAREKFPEVFEPLVIVSVNVDRKALTSKIVQNDILVSTSIDQVEILARKAIDAGEPVYLRYEHNSNYVDRKSGVMSIAGFNLPKNSGPLSRQQRAYFGTEGGGHAVQLIGYDAHPVTGKVLKWKIQNSWGEKSGDQGIFHMYSDYFRAFVRGLSFKAVESVDLPENNSMIERQLGFGFEFPN